MNTADRRMWNIVGILAALPLLFLQLGVSDADAKLTAAEDHDDIPINFFYNGSEVTVSGTADPGTELIITLTSVEEVGESFKKKEKVGGLLWMNTEDLEFEQVPDLYFLKSTGRLEEIIEPAAMNGYLIGYEALRQRCRIEPVKAESEKDKWFTEFVKLKRSRKLYAIEDNAITIGKEHGRQTYSARFEWPYQARPGKYTVVVHAIRDGKVVETTTLPLIVERVGAIKALTGMARNNGALYGILSIAIALGAGFGVGLLFKGGGAH